MKRGRRKEKDKTGSKKARKENPKKNQFAISDDAKLALQKLKEEHIEIKKFTLTDIKNATEYYEKYGFVIFNIIHSQNVREFLDRHIVNIQIHLHKYNLSDEFLVNQEDRSRHVNNIKRSKSFPSKLNLGCINNTMHRLSENDDGFIQKMTDLNVSSPVNQLHNIEAAFSSIQRTEKISTDFERLDDSISHSEEAWFLRSFCSIYYKALIVQNVTIKDDQVQLLSSIEDSTCMFSKKYHLNSLQEDRLHFFPGIIIEKKATKQLFENYTKLEDKRLVDTFNNNIMSIEEKIRYPRGFLSCNDGDSFSIVPCVHKYFSTFIKDMEQNGYSRKRTTTRAVPPKEYQFESIRIPLNKGDFIIYDPRLPKKLLTPTGEFNHYGLNTMFFDPIGRNLTKLDHSERVMACLRNVVINDERTFGYSFFTKRRGQHYLLDGTFQLKTPLFLFKCKQQDETVEIWKRDQYKIIRSLISHY